MRRTRRPLDILIFERRRAIARKVILAAKQQSWHNYCTSVNNNTKLPMVWRTIKNFSGSPTFTRRFPQLEQNGVGANNNQQKQTFWATSSWQWAPHPAIPKPSQKTYRPCMKTFAKPLLRLGHTTHESMLFSQWLNWKEPFLKPKILHQAMANFVMKCLSICPTTVLKPFSFCSTISGAPA